MASQAGADRGRETEAVKPADRQHQRNQGSATVEVVRERDSGKTAIAVLLADFSGGFWVSSG
ncbi:MAG TPA: hypothetical protein VKU82_02025, partial [Planctomycetaceae bacterium]|nr:hypothetical protein [Planctomycetaceae bacterium]